jgi:hypothetical protein
LAAPIVSAAVAGIKQMRPYVDTDMVKDILKATAIDLDEEGYDINTGWGMVDFAAIYDYVSEMPETIPENTPEIAIDYVNHKLMGFTGGDEYTINGVSVTPETDSIDIDDTWYGSTLTITKPASKTGFTDSEAQELSIPTIPEAPTTVSSEYNKIIGVTADMEYKPSTSDEWITCPETEITDVEAGVYDIRVKTTETSFASEIAQITVKNAPVAEIAPEITINYANNTLTGFSDDYKYTINGDFVAPENGKLEIDDTWYGTTVSIVTKARDEEHLDSTAYELSIPEIPEAPIGITSDYNSLLGMSENLECKLSTADTWDTYTDTEVIGLQAGVYDIRVKTTETSFAGKITQIEVKNAPIQEPVPEITIDYINKKLASFVTNTEYLINGNQVTTEDGSITIDDTWYGTTISIVTKARDEEHTDSTAQGLSIPSIPEAPTVTAGYNKITGTTSDMEYKLSNADSWTSCSNNETTNLEAGTYDVRSKATNYSFIGKASQIEVKNAPVPESIPVITINYTNNTLTGFSDDSIYTINGNQVTSEDGTITIDDTWYGTTLSIVTKARDEDHADSTAQELSIPTIPEAPTVTAGYNKITGTTKNMEYKLASSSAWITCANNETLNLEAGTYDVRLKATNYSFAGEITHIEVKNAPVQDDIPITPPADVVETYDLEASIVYDKEWERFICTYKNNTDAEIQATGILAIYDKSNCLVEIKTVDNFPVGEDTCVLYYNADEGYYPRFFIWSSLTTMQPLENTNITAYTNEEV